MKRKYCRLFVTLLVGSTVAGCAEPGPRMSFEERYPHAQCRYEVSVATANMGCVGCIEKNIAKFQAFDDLYRQCVSLKR
jgi:hypothetical protein